MSPFNGILILFASISFTFQCLGSQLVCFCGNNCHDNDIGNGTCAAKLGGYCFTAVEQVYNTDTGLLENDYTHGCLSPDEGGFMQCKGHLVPHKLPKSIACCNNYTMCNLYIKPNLVIPPVSPENDNAEYIIYLACATVLLLATLIILLCVVKFAAYRGRKKSRTALLEDGSSVEEKKPRIGDVNDQSSGSGSGVPLLMQRTIAKQTELLKSVGKGKFGEVWKGLYRGEHVAVKMFLTSDEASWSREQEIYQTVLLNHDNILGFIAADIRGTGSFTQLLLITDYHENGSLYDYLQTRVLDEYSVLKLMYSAVNGLCHLHTEIVAKQTKPAIAHRDIKSKNVLVKADGSCVIADFGLAVRYDSKIKEIDIAPNTRVGTKRYMPPEILNETFKKDNFDAYKQADMYSIALVLWEIGRRCAVSGVVEEYQVPYFDCLPNEPTFEDVRKIVCVDIRRPSFSSKWKQSDVLTAVERMIVECWHPSPCIRLSSLRVKKNLAKLLKDTTKLL